MIMCRALSYEENTLDKSRLKRSCLKIMQNRMALLTAPTLPTMGGLGLILTVRIGSA